MNNVADTFAKTNHKRLKILSQETKWHRSQRKPDNYLHYWIFFKENSLHYWWMGLPSMFCWEKAVRKITPRANANFLFGWSSTIVVGPRREESVIIYRMLIPACFAPKQSPFHICCSIVLLLGRYGTVYCKDFGGMRSPRTVAALILLLGGLLLARN